MIRIYFDDPNVTIIDNNVMPAGSINIPGSVQLRHFDPLTLEYSALDDSVNLNDLYVAMEEAAGRAQEWVDENNPHPRHA